MTQEQMLPEQQQTVQQLPLHADAQLAAWAVVVGSIRGTRLATRSPRPIVVSLMRISFEWSCGRVKAQGARFRSTTGPLPHALSAGAPGRGAVRRSSHADYTER